GRGGGGHWIRPDSRTTRTLGRNCPTTQRDGRECRSPRPFRPALWMGVLEMQLARVMGTVVASQKYEGLAGIKFLIVQPLDRQRRPEGEPVVAADATAQAGPDELVFIVGSREAAQALPNTFVPVDHAIVGIVDDVHTEQD